MDRIPSKRSRFFAIPTIGLIALTSWVAVSKAADDPATQTSGTISYVSGGVGDESLARLNTLAAKFNLKMVFALKSGAYLSDVRVVIADAKARTMLDTMSQGPWFMVKLPEGNYEVAVSFSGKTETRRVAIKGKNLKTIDFRWNSE